MSRPPADGPVRVLEWIRSPIRMWTLPRELVPKLAEDVPQVSVMSPATREEADSLLAEAEVVLGFGETVDDHEGLQRCPDRGPFQPQPVAGQSPPREPGGLVRLPGQNGLHGQLGVLDSR